MFQADVKVVGNGNDYSERVNKFLNDTLPDTLERYQVTYIKLMCTIFL